MLRVIYLNLLAYRLISVSEVRRCKFGGSLYMSSCVRWSFFRLLYYRFWYLVYLMR